MIVTTNFLLYSACFEQVQVSRRRHAQIYLNQTLQEAGTRVHIHLFETRRRAWAIYRKRDFAGTMQDYFPIAGHTDVSSATDENVRIAGHTEFLHSQSSENSESW